MPIITSIPRGIEGAVNDMITVLRKQYPTAILAMQQELVADGFEADLIAPDPDRYYTTELLDPIQTPAVFVLADRSEHKNEQGQNFLDQEHTILAGVAMDEAQDVSKLKRVVERYAMAMWMILHELTYRDIYVLVQGIDYSPTFVPKKASQRVFRQDATLRCRVLHLEQFNNS